MKVITFPADKASAPTAKSAEDLLLSMFRALPPKDKRILLNVVDVMVSHTQAPAKPAERSLTLV